MAQSEITVSLSLKYRWWVKPLLHAARLWYICRLPIDPYRFAKWVGGRSIVVRTIDRAD